MTTKKQEVRKVPNIGNQPCLRFPEFEGEWERKKLGELARFSKGKGISKAEIEENGKTECIRYGELYTTYNEIIDTVISKTNTELNKLILSEENDIIIPASGETQIDIATASCVMKSGVALGGDLNIIKTPLNGIFLSYYLNSKKKVEIANLAQGISVVHLYSSQLSTLEINYPSLQEQSKIADFLSLSETRIQQSSKIIEGLETLMKEISEKLFSKKLRFKSIDGSNLPDWQTKRLKEIGTCFSGGTPLTSKKHYYNGDIPFIKSGEINSNQTEQFISELGLKESSAKMVKVGDVIYALYGATSGEVGLSKIDGAINQAILCIRTDLNNVFLMNYLKLKKEIIIKTYLQGGQGNLSAEIIKNLEVPIPCSTEQAKIADFLSSIIEKIETEKQILDQYKNQKTYFLQNMFI